MLHVAYGTAAVRVAAPGDTNIKHTCKHRQGGNTLKLSNNQYAQLRMLEWGQEGQGKREGSTAGAMTDQHTMPREVQKVTAKGKTYWRCRGPQRRRCTT